MKYYCIGIKGTGMSTLAQILNDLGHQVSGYDDAMGHKFTQVGLEERNIPIYYDHDHPIDPDTIVTYSAAFQEDHPELIRVRNMGLKIIKYNELVGHIMDMFDSIGISGTHGKTTTASLIRHILTNNGGCNYFIGAGDGYAVPNNNYFVVECDEFNHHFLAYHPKYSVITNIEPEHLECYKDIDDIRKAFEQFANQTSELVVACGDNPEVRKINYQSRVIFYGFNFTNEVVIKNVNLSEVGSRFDIFIKEDLYGSFQVPLFGKHMVANVCAAILICKELGVPKEVIYQSLKTFKNAQRRFAIEKVKETTLVDDYAHHPTEIKATIESARQRFPGKRIVAIFKPNTYSRTRDFEDEFVSALSRADKVYLTEIECDRERPEDYPGVSSENIINKIEGAELINEQTISKLGGELDSVILFMSCAHIAGLVESLKSFINSSNKEGDN